MLEQHFLIQFITLNKTEFKLLAGGSGLESSLGVENGVWGSTINGQFMGLKISLNRELVSSSKSAFISAWKTGVWLWTESVPVIGLNICLSIGVETISLPSANISVFL